MTHQSLSAIGGSGGVATGAGEAFGLTDILALGHVIAGQCRPRG